MASPAAQRCGENWTDTLPSPLPTGEVSAVVEGVLFCPASRRRACLHRHPPAARLQIVAALIEAGYAFRHSTPKQYLKIARVARQACRYLNVPAELRPEARQVRIAADAFLANACRILGRFPEAHRRWTELGEVEARVEGNAILGGLVYRFRGGLARARRRFSEAILLLSSAVACFHEAGARRQESQALLVLAKTWEDSGEPERALTILRQLFERLDARRHPDLSLIAFHNLVHLLTELGRLGWAAFLLREIEWWYGEVDQPLLRIRAIGLKGRLLREVGAPEDAVPLLATVREELLARGMGYDAAVVGLEEALAHAMLHQERQVRELALEMYPVFTSHDIPREATMALLQFHDAALDYRAEAPLIRQVMGRLQALQREPLPAL